jgi:hypothetical protein
MPKTSIQCVLHSVSVQTGALQQPPMPTNGCSEHPFKNGIPPPIQASDPLSFLLPARSSAMAHANPLPVPPMDEQRARRPCHFLPALASSTSDFMDAVVGVVARLASSLLLPALSHGYRHVLLHPAAGCLSQVVVDGPCSYLQPPCSSLRKVEEDTLCLWRAGPHGIPFVHKVADFALPSNIHISSFRAPKNMKIVLLASLWNSLTIGYICGYVLVEKFSVEIRI